MSLNRVVAGVLAVVSVGGCGGQGPDDGSGPDETVASTAQAIQGGALEAEHLYPWVVTVDGSCHGVLVDPSWVLTAAHCVDASTIPIARYSRTDPYTGVVHAGSRYARSNPSRLVYKHPDYNPATLRNDIALFKLDTPFTLDRYIQTVAIPAAASGAGNVAAVASYIRHGGTRPAGKVVVMRAPIAASSVCGAGTSELCFQKNDAALCNGDSGSGLVRNVGASLASNGRATVVGVASNTPANNCSSDDLGLPVTMMDVYRYRTWISQTMSMSLADLAGDARLRYEGQASRGQLELRCERSPFGSTTKSSVGPMNAPGVELRHACGAGTRARASCTGVTGAAITGFKLTTTNKVNGASSTTNLPFTASSASYVTSYDATGILIREFSCTVGPILTR